MISNNVTVVSSVFFQFWPFVLNSFTQPPTSGNGDLPNSLRRKFKSINIPRCNISHSELSTQVPLHSVKYHSYLFKDVLKNCLVSMCSMQITNLLLNREYSLLFSKPEIFFSTTIKNNSDFLYW